MVEQTNRERIETLEKKLRLRINRTRKGKSSDMSVSGTEADEYISLCEGMKKESEELYNEIYHLLTPDIRMKLDSIHEQSRKLHSTLCYIPSSLQSNMSKAYHEATDGSEEIKKATHVIGVLGKYFG